jgi:hypothetical protein
MPNNPSEDTAVSMMLDIQRRLTALENFTQIGNVSIQKGALQILDPLGRLVVSVGYQPDGSIGIGMYNPATGVRIISLGQTPGELSLYALSVLNSAGVLQQVAGTVANVATANQTLTVSGAAPVAFSDGPSVTAIIGPSGEAEVGLGAFVASDNVTSGFTELAVDGAVWVIPSTTTPMLSCAGGNNNSSFGTGLITGLSPGSHTFSHMYQFFGNSPVIFSERNIVVNPH